MPNALVHIGVNGIATKALIKNSDLKWIYIGAIIPDLPWMLQRVIKILPDINIYDLRAFAIVQASFVFCLIAAAALSAFSRFHLKTFIILSFGALIHLLSDALEIKWANGVHLFAPFSWKLINFGFFWPESIFITLLTAGGLIFFFAYWKDTDRTPAGIEYKSRNRYLFFIILLSAYYLLPFLFSDKPYEADNHYIKTLSLPEREGLYVEIDRRDFRIEGDNKIIETFAGEELNITGIVPDQPATISLRGRFTDNKTLKVSEYHEHNAALRDGASYAALLLIAAVWVRSLRKK